MDRGACRSSKSLLTDGKGGSVAYCLPSPNFRKVLQAKNKWNADRDGEDGEDRLKKKGLPGGNGDSKPGKAADKSPL